MTSSSSNDFEKQQKSFVPSKALLAMLGPPADDATVIDIERQADPFDGLDVTRLEPNWHNLFMTSSLFVDGTACTEQYHSEGTTFLVPRGRGPDPRDTHSVRLLGEK